MDGYVSLGDYLSVLDDSRSSGMPAFLEQGTPESELADPTSFLTEEEHFSAGKTALEEEQKQDLWLAVGRDYRLKPKGLTFQKRVRGRAISHAELASMLRSEAPTVNEETVPEVVQPGMEVQPSRAQPSRAVAPRGSGVEKQKPESMLQTLPRPRLRAARYMTRRSGLGQLPPELMPEKTPVGVSLIPAARIEKAPLKVLPPGVEKEKLNKWARILGLGVLGVTAGLVFMSGR